VYFQRGRALSMSDGRYLVAISQDTIPESWSDAVGAEFVGTPFAEHPDAEEDYKARVNRKEQEWGKGPDIRTTFNYTGLVITPDEDELMPVRISFQRTTKSAHEKLQTLKKATMRNKPWWDAAFELTTKERTFGRNTAFIVEVKKGRETTAEEKGQAVELAGAVIGGRVTDNSEDAEKGSARVAPEAVGGLDV
jgi:hypothetical protein